MEDFFKNHILVEHKGSVSRFKNKNRTFKFHKVNKKWPDNVCT